MVTIVYLDPEDEITSAATRIRQAPGTRVALVVPFGSRVATSRINFRLLAREAMVNGRRLDIVAPDASARALAASAGIPVFASIGEYEAALDVPDAVANGDPGGGTAAASAVGGGASGSTVAEPAPTPSGQVPAGAVAGFALTGRSGAAPPPVDPAAQAELDAAVRRTREEPAVRKPRRRAPAALLAVLLLLVVVAGAAAAAGFLLLPSAEITVTPVIQPVGPVTLTVRADPESTTVDEDAQVIPAQMLDIPVQASGEFKATGKRVERTPATGGVRWRNCDPTASYNIPKGTQVRTASGIAFATEEPVFLPVAIISGGGATPQLKCQSSEVAITAVKAGKDGNVGARRINVVPARYNRTVISVTNPAPTTGGSETSFTRVSRKDVDAALASLQEDLETQFAAEIENPAIVPEGSTGFPETAVLGEAVPSVDPTTLVNQEVESFSLALDATGTMLAVDPSPVEPMAAARLASEVTPGYELVEGSTRVRTGDGTVVDGVVTFEAVGVAKEIRPVDGSALAAQVLGLSEADARAVLDPYGEVKVVLWPDWVDRVPTLQQRVVLVVGEPVDSEPASSEAPSPSTGTGSPDGEVPSEPLPSR